MASGPGSTPASTPWSTRPTPPSTSSSASASRRSSARRAGQVGGEGGGLALLEPHRHAELLQVLLERLSPQGDLVALEEVLHVALPVRAHQHGDALVEAPVGAARVLPGHRFPVLLDEIPG